jgi:murein DD-endopeptidase MepM/ murein hydrolase activator NlpD
MRRTDSSTAIRILLVLSLLLQAVPVATRAQVDDDCAAPPNWGAGRQNRSGACEAGLAEGEAPNWGQARTSAVSFDVSATNAPSFAVTDPGIDLTNLSLAEAVGQALGESPPVVQISFADPGAGAAEQNQNLISDPLDPRWTNVNQWNTEILAAQAQVFTELAILVPANVVKAVMMIETQGIVPDGANSAGARGLMQVTPNSMGGAIYDHGRIERDPAYSIYCGVYELALRYEHSGGREWRDVILGYFSGHYDPTGATDGYNNDFQYQAAFDANMAELKAAAPHTTPSVSVNPVDPAGIPAEWLAGVRQPLIGLAYMWGETLVAGAPAGLTQEFGPTEWSLGGGRWMYEYAYAYGFLEPGHTGLDINLPAGTSLYAPTDAVIVCAGTNNGPLPGSRESSCTHFISDYGGATSGRLELELPNQDLLIFGHVNQTTRALGEAVKAGDLIGYSGGQFGDHLHLEYRTADPSTSAKWRIIDPRLTELNLQPVLAAGRPAALLGFSETPLALLGPPARASRPKPLSVAHAHSVIPVRFGRRSPQRPGRPLHGRWARPKG